MILTVTGIVKLVGPNKNTLVQLRTPGGELIDYNVEGQVCFTGPVVDLYDLVNDKAVYHNLVQDIMREYNIFWTEIRNAIDQRNRSVQNAN